MLEPVAPAVEPEPVVPAVEPEVEPLPDGIDELVSSVPVTSTRLPALDASCDCADPGSRMYVEPELMLALLPDPLVAEPVGEVPVVPDVEPVEPEVEEPVRVEPDELPVDMDAFVKMNDAPFPLPDAERDALVPEVAVPPVEPVVPVVPLASPDCRQPTTVIVPLCDERFALLCCDPLV